MKGGLNIKFKMVNIYKKKWGVYRKVGTASSVKEAHSMLQSYWGKGRYRIGLSRYVKVE